MNLRAVFKSRWLRITALAVFALTVLAGGLAYTLVDSRKIADLAASAVQKATGRSLKLAGPVSLKVFPRLAVVAENVSFGNAPWASDPLMAQADKVAFALEWSPLLHGAVSVSQIELNGVVLNLQRAPAGQNVAGNWVIAPNAAKADDATERKKADASHAGFKLESVQINNAQIRLRDAAGALTQSVEIEQLQGSLSTSSVTLAGRIRWQAQPIALQGQIGFKPDTPLDVALKINAEQLDLRKAAAAEDKPATSSSHATDSRWLFTPAPLGLAALPLLNGHIGATIGSLTLPNGITLPNFSIKLALDADAGGVLTLEQLASGFGQGTITLAGQLRGYTSKTPQIQLRGHAKGFTLDKALAQVGKRQSLIQGGPGEAAFHVIGSAKSLRDMASGLNGELQLSVGAATLGSAWLNEGGDFVVSLLNAINPLHKTSEATQLQCAVAYLPVKNGVIPVTQSIGIETDRLGLSFNGTINLKNETLNLTLNPSEKAGLSTGLNAAGLVQISGSLRHPGVGLNQRGVVKQATNVGLAVLTGGLSVAAQNLGKVLPGGNLLPGQSSAAPRNPCQNVLRSWASVSGGL